MTIINTSGDLEVHLESSMQVLRIIGTQYKSAMITLIPNLPFQYIEEMHQEALDALHDYPVEQIVCNPMARRGKFCCQHQPCCADGASCILNEAVLEDARQRLDTDSMIVLPSSRHEVIVLGESNDTDPISLGSMVREINGSTVSPEDFLSDNSMTTSRSKT